MLELFLSALEDQLGLIVDPPLAPIARMGIISQEIARITSSGLTSRAADASPEKKLPCSCDCQACSSCSYSGEWPP